MVAPPSSENPESPESRSESPPIPPPLLPPPADEAVEGRWEPSRPDPLFRRPAPWDSLEGRNQDDPVDETRKVLKYMYMILSFQ